MNSFTVQLSGISFLPLEMTNPNCNNRRAQPFSPRNKAVYYLATNATYCKEETRIFLVIFFLWILCKDKKNHLTSIKFGVYIACWFCKPFNDESQLDKSIWFALAFKSHESVTSRSPVFLACSLLRENHDNCMSLRAQHLQLDSLQSYQHDFHLWTVWRARNNCDIYPLRGCFVKNIENITRQNAGCGHEIVLL